jgi:hypothetical protein
MLQACGAIEGTIDYAKSLIIKEKEQIINAAKSCNYIGGATDIEAEKYYNQTYNQTNVGNDGFEFDNSSTIPPPKTNNL